MLCLSGAVLLTNVFSGSSTRRKKDIFRSPSAQHWQPDFRFFWVDHEVQSVSTPQYTDKIHSHGALCLLHIYTVCSHR